jgi:hypothetical protein
MRLRIVPVQILRVRFGVRLDGWPTHWGDLGCVAAPNDVTISVSAAFASHLESFWREAVVLTLTVIVGGFCGAVLNRRGR